ncbi:MAG: hypothetical protein IKY43_01160 [Bacteroidales bacterium]|nr:hypothetical protein [Bacteroidales bacterium]
MKTTRILILGLFAALGTLLMPACTDDSASVPSFVEVTAFKVVDSPSSSVSRYEGCFTSDINAVEITVKTPTENALIGVFELPCRVPILKEGKCDIVLKPAIKLNGISATRSAYPFYTDAIIKNVNLVPDSVIVIDTQSVTYTNYVNFAWTEYCERFVTNPFSPDTIVRLMTDKDSVRSDNASAAIYMSPEQESLEFTSRDSCVVYNNDALILELDYWTNVPLEVGMKSKQTSAGIEETYYSIYLYPNDGWEKIYIQLGRLWSTVFNYYDIFKIAFRVSNPDGIEAKTYIDNIKLTSY